MVISSQCPEGKFIGEVTESLIEETESHVVIFFLYLGGSCSCGGGTGSGGSSSRGGTSSGHGSKLALALLKQLLDVLAGELLGDHVDLGVVSIDANRAEDLLNVGGGGFSSTEDGEHGSSNVTHV